MTYVRERHRVIAIVLGCLDPAVLRDHHCYFAGGTALAMRFGEYRESVDVDFLVSDDDSYRELRSLCRGPQGFDAITLPGQRVVTADGLRIDRYGIRTRLDVAGLPVKFEIVHEGRIDLDEPSPADQVLGVTTATVVDLVASKLLANSDRWADPSVFSRDIIDLAMIRPERRTLVAGLRKAEQAYGSSAHDDAVTAIDRLLADDRLVDRCQQALGMTAPRAVLVDRLRRLSASLARASATLSGPG